MLRRMFECTDPAPHKPGTNMQLYALEWSNDHPGIPKPWNVVDWHIGPAPTGVPMLVFGEAGAHVSLSAIRLPQQCYAQHAHASCTCTCACTCACACHAHVHAYAQAATCTCTCTCTHAQQHDNMT
eukprot:4063025-Prymnesium_polylepis.2